MLQKKSEGLLNLLAVYVNGVFVLVSMSVNSVVCHQKKCNVCKNSSFSLNERRKFRFWS